MHINSCRASIVPCAKKILSRWIISRLNLTSSFVTWIIDNHKFSLSWKIEWYFNSWRPKYHARTSWSKNVHYFILPEDKYYRYIQSYFQWKIMCLLIYNCRQKCNDLLTSELFAFIYVHLQNYEIFIAPIEGLLRCRHCSFFYIYISRISW